MRVPRPEEISLLGNLPSNVRVVEQPTVFVADPPILRACLHSVIRSPIGGSKGVGAFQNRGVGAVPGRLGVGVRSGGGALECRVRRLQF